jgi:apolipoprotein N-acyltransferase
LSVGAKGGCGVSKPLPQGVVQCPEEVRDRRQTWLWLAIGFAFIPFTITQTMLPLAAWLAPIFLLRFARTFRRPTVALLLIWLAQTFGRAIALRGGGAPILWAVEYLTMYCVVRGLESTLPYVADRLLYSRLDDKTRTFVFPLALVTVEWLSTLGRELNAGGLAVYSQYDSLPLLQILSVTGMWGVIFLMGWAASAANAVWGRGFDWPPARGAAISFVAVLLAVVLFGSIRLNFAAPSSPTVVAATVTMDRALFEEAFPQRLDWATFNTWTEEEREAVRPHFQATADQMLERSESALRAGAKIVGWQEATAAVLEEDRQQTLDRASDLAKRYDAYIQVWLAVFTRAPTHHYYLNQSILIDNAGRIRATYTKTYPTYPAEAYIGIAGPGKLPIIETAYGRIATAICNDFNYPALIRQAGQGDADIMMAPTNDIIPWQQQDAVIATFRALENGYSMVKATGIGASMIMDYQGRVLGQQRYGDGGGVMLATIPTRGVVTIYSRIGDSFAYLNVAALILLAGWALMRKPSVAAAVR